MAIFTLKHSISVPVQLLFLSTCVPEAVSSIGGKRKMKYCINWAFLKSKYLFSICTPAKSSKALKKLYVKNVPPPDFKEPSRAHQEEVKWSGVFREHWAMGGTVRRRNSRTTHTWGTQTFSKESVDPGRTGLTTILCFHSSISTGNNLLSLTGT